MTDTEARRTDPDRLVTWRELERQIRRQDAIEGQYTRLEREQLRAMNRAIDANRRALEQLMAAQESAEQPEWIGNRDPAVALRLLTETRDWVGLVGEDLCLELKPCWPWHSGIVALLLAAANHYRAIHKGKNPVAITDFHTRYVDAIGKRATTLMRGCDRHRHQVGGAHFECDHDPEQLPVLAAWHAEGRQGQPPLLEDFVATPSDQHGPR